MVLVWLPVVIAVGLIAWSLCVAARIGDEAMQRQSVDDDWSEL